MPAQKLTPVKARARTRAAADGIIELDSEAGKVLGFTSDRFDGYLWRTGQTITISFIESRARGNFRALVTRILGLGFTVNVPTPSRRMESIVRRNGYTRRVELDPQLGAVEVWSLKLVEKPIA